MNQKGLTQVTLFALVIISILYLSTAVESQPRALIDSPVLKEVEYKKALFYNNRKPITGTVVGKLDYNADGKKVIKIRRVTPNKQKPSTSSRLTISDESKNGKITRSSSAGIEGTSDSSSKNGTTTSTVVSPTNSSSTTDNSKTSTTSSNNNENEMQQTAASDRIFMPPYKMPFWGLPYGVYSNAGFINPGLFPFVPGGPGFPPYDGIFGSPFGPGKFPGNQSPFPPGVGTPMDPGPLPVPPIYAPPAAVAAAAAATGAPSPVAYGQPPLNPTGRRSNGPPPGAFSPGSPIAYPGSPMAYPGSPMSYYYRQPPRRPPSMKTKKKKKKPKAEPEETTEASGGCNCNKGEDDSHSHSYKKYKTTSTTPDPCPCNTPTTPSSKPSYRKEVYDDDEYHHHHHHHHDHSDTKNKPESYPCPLATPPPTPTTTEYVPPPTTTAYEKPPETTTTAYASSSETPRPKKPCKLRHRPTNPPLRTVYYEYDSMPNPMAAPERKPCPLQYNTEYVPATEAPAPTPPIYYQAASPPSIQTLPYPPPPSPPVVAQYAQPQYITATAAPASPVPQESQLSHSTILYKPMAQEVVHTPTSVTVPLPFPFALDSNGVFQPQKSPLQNSQQVTYKMELNPELLNKITTPVVVTQPQAQQQQHLVHSIQSSFPAHQQIQQLPNSYQYNGNSQFVIDGQHLAVPTQGQPSAQSRVVILDGSTLNPVNQFYQSPSPSPVSISYAQPNNSPTSDYKILLAGGGNNFDSPSNNNPYRTSISTFQAEHPTRRQQIVTRNDDSRISNKNLVIIDRSELEELQKTLSGSERLSSSIDRNRPPSPDAIHIQFHSKLDDDRDKPLSFHSEKNRAQQQKTVFVESNSEPIAEGSSPFSRIFELNNDDIVSAGRRIGLDRDVGNHATIFRTSLVFDKYLRNDHDRLK